MRHPSTTPDSSRLEEQSRAGTQKSGQDLARTHEEIDLLTPLLSKDIFPLHFNSSLSKKVMTLAPKAAFLSQFHSIPHPLALGTRSATRARCGNRHTLEAPLLGVHEPSRAWNSSWTRTRPTPQSICESACHGKLLFFAVAN